MKYKRYVYDSIPNNFLLLVLVTLFFLKVAIYLLVTSKAISFSLGGGSDANYYDAYAQGIIDIALNIWPIILRYLSNIGLYSREAISYLFLTSNLLIIPIIVTRLADIRLKKNQKYYFYILLVCFLYPTLYFFTFDVYRDVFMVLCFLIGCLAVKTALTTKSSMVFISLFAVSMLIGLFLAALRPYLGVAFIGALFLWKIRFTKKRIAYFSVLYLLVLFIANYVGLLEPLTEYRSSFEEIGGGSTLGLNFSNPMLFIPNFILSFLGQMLGLYITNPLALILLIIETVPFFFMLIYVVKNIKWADKFVRFLVLFFVLYASVWLIGNDNLGTAVRLRLYNYFTVYIAFFYILRLKSLHSRKI